MGYYQAGDYYRRGDGVWDKPGAIVRAGARALGGFMPGGSIVGGAMAAAASPIASAGIKAGKALFDLWGSPVRRYRRMNPLNPKALRRAIRRANSFEHFARSVINVTHRGGKKKWKFHRKRRSR
jgi:hypothetical protein